MSTTLNLRKFDVVLIRWYQRLIDAIRKKQFDYKVAKWGLYKNTTSLTERRRLVEESGLGDVKLEVTSSLVKVNPAKLKRWEKQIKAGSSLHPQQRLSNAGKKTLPFLYHRGY